METAWPRVWDDGNEKDSSFLEGMLEEQFKVQSSVKTFPPGFGNAWLKYCAVVHLWGGQLNILRVILEN